MQRQDCLKSLVPYIRDQLIILSLGRTADEWEALCPRDGNMFDSGMGHHIPLALGLAIALPHRQVIVLDTDGSVLMLLSALTALGIQPAKNLKVFVFDNEAYEGTGGQPSATAGSADISAIARGAGVTGAKTVRDLGSFQAAAEEALTTEGMAFIVAKVGMTTAPVPSKEVGNREALIRFVRYVEKTENIKIFHTKHS